MASLLSLSLSQVMAGIYDILLYVVQDRCEKSLCVKVVKCESRKRRQRDVNLVLSLACGPRGM